MKTFLLALFLLSLPIKAFSASEQLAQKLLQQSDRARGGVKEGLTWKSKVSSIEDGETLERTFTIKAKGNNAVVEALAPARTKGEIMIFNDRNMWFYKPSLKKPVSISPRQKLTGQAANGDIASTQYARDYTPTLERTENSGSDKTHVLLLKAKAPNLTYDQIRYWVEEKRGLATKAEFLTLQGQVFKVAQIEYGNQISIGGQTYPFVKKLTITDAKFKQNQSIIEYENPKIQDFPDSIFNVNNLAR